MRFPSGSNLAVDANNTYVWLFHVDIGSGGFSVDSSRYEDQRFAGVLSPATFANPPFNLVVPEMVSALHSVVQEMDGDQQVKVLLFKSATEGFFLNHFDLGQAQNFPMEAADPPLPTWVDLVLRLVRISEYKRKQAAIGLKVTGVAFGSGRRVPIAQGWREGEENGE